MKDIIKNIADVIIGKGQVNIPKKELTSTSTSNALKIVFGIAGGISLIIMMIGAFQYVISQGEPQAINKAKNTIIYALIGLAVCALAFTIVGYVARNVS